MVTTIFRVATTTKPKLATFKTTRNRVATITTRNVAIVPNNNAIISRDCHDPYQKLDSVHPNNIVTKKEKSSINGPQIPCTMEFELQQVVQKIKGIMRSKAKKDIEVEELIMIDVLQRLSLENYFQEEIQLALERLSAKFCSFENGEVDGFYEVALCFRLLRQNGIYVRSDIYNTFKDKNGEFKEKLSKDVKALLSIFEACELSTQAEEILCEASNFCKELLETSLKGNIYEQSQAGVIENTLKSPYHKSSPILLAKYFLQAFDVSLKYLHNMSIVNDQWINEVQVLARIDFEMAQMTYKNEIQQISGWVKDKNFDKELGGFARVKPWKWCMWSLGVIPGPNMSEERLELAKVVGFSYMIDDIFDTHHIYDELCLFTEAVKRWENADTKQLPKCMKVCFNALVETTNDFSFQIQRNYGFNPKQCLRKMWVEQFQAFLNESKWSSMGYIPTSEEYLNNAIVTSGVHVFLAHAYFLMGQGINDLGIQELHRRPPIISSTAMILRLWNDFGIHTDITPNGMDRSYLDCYMKEQKSSSSLESARVLVNQKILGAWQSLNGELMSPVSPFTKDFKLACLNLARMVPIMYNHDKFNHIS